MTLPLEKVGDKGQRYVVRTFRWPDETKEWQNAGYCSYIGAAHKMQAKFWDCPGVQGVQIIDRKRDETTVYWGKK